MSPLRPRALLLLALLAACEGDHPASPSRAAAEAAAHPRSPTVTSVGIAADAGPDTLVDMPDTLAFHGAFSDALDAIGPWSWTIAWGDSTSTSGTASSVTPGIAASHAYAREGIDTLVLTVADVRGASAADSAVITVVDHVKKVVVTPARASLDVADTTSFAATALGMTGNVLAGRSFTWKSSSTSIATVVASGATTGIATGVSAGTTKIYAYAEGARGSATAYVFGLPLAPFHLPDASFARPYTGVFRAATPATILATLTAARKRHFRVVLYLVASSRDYSNPDSTFSLALWEQSVDRYRGIDFSSYIADGTIVGHYLIAEPRDPGNWGGVAVSFADIDAAAAYSKSVWPTMPTGAGSEASDLEAGAPYQSLDFAFSQYRDRKGDVATWLASEIASAVRANLGLVLSINLLDGNLDGSSYDATRLRAVGIPLAGASYACALTMWKYDSAYFADTSIKAAMSSIAKVANRRPRHRCGPD